MLAAVSAVFLLAPPTLHPQATAKRAVLSQIDSVTVIETPTIQVNRVGEVAVSYIRTYIADPKEWRVLEVSRQGKITRTFGRRGQGPGEFEHPGSMVVAGDELLVMDFNLRRVSVFSTTSGKFLRSFLLNAFLPHLGYDGNELFAAAFDESRKTSLLRLSMTGDVLGHEGTIPAIAQRLPMLLQPFPHQAIEVDPFTVYMMSELSNSLYSWPRGGGKVTQLAIPTRGRRGANEAAYEQMVKDPQKAGAIAYDHSVPVAMSMSAAKLLAMISYDPVYSNGKFSGRYHVTVIDVDGRRACPDVPIPVSPDPLAKVGLLGSRITVVQQVVAGGDAVTTIRRLRIDPSACDWVAIK